MKRCLASILWVPLAVPLFGAGKKWTEAMNKGFAGPIMSVSTTHQEFMPKPEQPDYATIFYPVPCGECAFDKEGNETMTGWGENSGTSYRHVRLDASGMVAEEWWQNEKGEELGRHVYANGPYGKLSDEAYQG